MDPEPLADGQLEQSDGRWCLRFVRKLAHAPETVWSALTEPEHLSAWFPTDIEGERKSGASLRFRFRGGEGPTVDGEMIAYEPPRLLELRWGDEETLRFELEPDDHGTMLTFVDSFDQLGKAARDAAGWHASLDVLALHLDGRPAPWSPAERWSQVHDSYVERFGPEASTIGPPAGAVEQT
ncbi:MAG: ATPase [Candidatus Nephthysia bennettiae]|uniref:SRPBCC family protein n=1 Tax=Candidatus Nephthysia bennettiae TaxID=3127016 RepID=A0A934N4K6_9BACT|nr:SRPBCC family protein [Candidatus Dormibacteraeota bacterium]PZR84734.1 MAG: ATPase [Candidatus Dormibacteraeota bacterium]